MIVHLVSLSIRPKPSRAGHQQKHTHSNPPPTHTATLHQHTHTRYQNKQMLSGLNLLSHPLWLVNFGGGRPNSFKHRPKWTVQPAVWVEDSKKPDMKRSIFSGPHIATNSRATYDKKKKNRQITVSILKRTPWPNSTGTALLHNFWLLKAK